MLIATHVGALHHPRRRAVRYLAISVLVRCDAYSGACVCLSVRLRVIISSERNIRVYAKVMNRI